MTNFHALTQDFDNKSENCNNKGGDNLLQSDKSEMSGPRWMISDPTDTEETHQRLALHTVVAVMMTFNSVLLQYFRASFGLVLSQNSVPNWASKKINLLEPDCF